MRPSWLRLHTLALVFAISSTGCREPTKPACQHSQSSDLQRFSVRGKIVGVQAEVVTLDHEAVPGFMDAMTMPYHLKDPSVASELHPGDRITATILVHKGPDGFEDPMLDEIVITAQARPDYKPAIQYHIPQPGDAVPNFAVRNQSDHMLHLDQFRGKLLLTTFIYTRCTVADFCPRMSRNFAEINSELEKNPKLYIQTHLLTISFDPTYDSPQVLRSYGGAYTGRYTEETFSHWDFAAPSPKDLLKLAEWFGVGVQPGPNGSLNHSLSTALIGKDGRIIIWYHGNDWTPAEMMAEIRKQAPTS